MFKVPCVEQKLCAHEFGAILGHRFGGVERVRPRQGGFSGAAGEITQGASALRAG